MYNGRRGGQVTEDEYSAILEYILNRAENQLFDTITEVVDAASYEFKMDLEQGEWEPCIKSYLRSKLEK
jgi:hypothetical protein